MNKNSTRYYSNRQEKQVAKSIGGKQTANSGATKFVKGDILTDNFLIECKTTLTPKKSFAIKKEWLDKNRQEMFAMNKSYNALAFNFEPDGKNYYVIDERLFKYLKEKLEEDDE